MPIMTTRDRLAYRADESKDHNLLSEKERQRMLQVWLLSARYCADSVD